MPPPNRRKNSNGLPWYLGQDTIIIPSSTSSGHSGSVPIVPIVPTVIKSDNNNIVDSSTDCIDNDKYDYSSNNDVNIECKGIYSSSNIHDDDDNGEEIESTLMEHETDHSQLPTTSSQPQSSSSQHLHTTSIPKQNSNEANKNDSTNTIQNNNNNNVQTNNHDTFHPPNHNNRINYNYKQRRRSYIQFLNQHSHEFVPFKGTVEELKRLSSSHPYHNNNNNHHYHPHGQESISYFISTKVLASLLATSLLFILFFFRNSLLQRTFLGKFMKKNIKQCSTSSTTSTLTTKCTSSNNHPTIQENDDNDDDSDITTSPIQQQQQQHEHILKTGDEFILQEDIVMLSSSSVSSSNDGDEQNGNPTCNTHDILPTSTINDDNDNDDDNDDVSGRIGVDTYSKNIERDNDEDSYYNNNNEPKLIPEIISNETITTPNQIQSYPPKKEEQGFVGTRNHAMSIHVVAEKYHQLGLDPQKALELSVQHNFMLLKTQREEHLRQLEVEEQFIEKSRQEVQKGCDMLRHQSFQLIFGTFHLISCILTAYSSNILVKNKGVLLKGLFESDTIGSTTSQQEWRIGQGFVVTVLQEGRDWWSHEICGCSNLDTAMVDMHEASINSWISLGTSFISGTVVSMIPINLFSMCEFQCAISAIPLVVIHRLSSYLIPRTIHQMVTRILVVGSLLCKTPMGLSLLKLVYSILSINSLLSIMGNVMSYQKKREIYSVQVGTTSTSERDLKDMRKFLDKTISCITAFSYVAAFVIGAVLV